MRKANIDKKQPGLLQSFYAGTSGLVLPVPNKTFYPDEYRDKSRLCYYSSLFNSIEINSSFYKLPRKPTVGKWTHEVEDDFKFSYKLWKEITHTKNLEFDPEKVFQFMDAISAAGSMKGCLLVQFPGKISIAYAGQINELLNCIGKTNEAGQWSIQVEFRNPSLYHAEIYSMLREHAAGLVVHDMNNSQTPLHKVDSDTIYVRFHGPGEAFRGTYSDRFLQRYAGLAGNWLRSKKQVYVYFNNTLGTAVHDLMRLKEMVKLQ